MHRTLQAVLAGTLAVMLSTSVVQRPAAAQPNGKTTTYEIGIGAALLGYLAKLSIDNGKANRSRGDAMTLMEKPQAPLFQFKNGSASPPASARELRVTILNTIKDKGATLGRAQYEVLRTCWNGVIVPHQPASDKQQPAAPATPDCTARSADLDAALANVIDKQDASNAFASAPPLYQQIVDLRVGSHATENEVRIQTIYVLGEMFLNFKPPPQPKPNGPLAAVVLKDVFETCVTSQNTFGCAGLIGSAEASAAADHRVAVACDFARFTWLPTFSAAVAPRSAPVDAHTDFGPAPGC